MDDNVKWLLDHHFENLEQDHWRLAGYNGLDLEVQWRDDMKVWQAIASFNNEGGRLDPQQWFSEAGPRAALKGAVNEMYKAVEQLHADLDTTDRALGACLDYAECEEGFYEDMEEFAGHTRMSCEKTEEDKL